ncbi:MAG: hypothetical protein DWQ31_01780 [Planctomycetota bacterium]|nr:MAG: hypothetical protein DWQ31_01780 [Planctomycetota bacterium]REJ87192.1 MAG: hypothetical protein DWQ35_21850 [Planctomycetota bacterium]REK23844.1 MAG: hypothetical protein DWQ42_14325 [Planctomycetota bacterium]REK44720.1 MAG: hypothetical protein DWQ46_08760 [Planctomycetota bacterium]
MSTSDSSSTHRQAHGETSPQAPADGSQGTRRSYLRDETEELEQRIDAAHVPSRAPASDAPQPDVADSSLVSGPATSSAANSTTDPERIRRTLSEIQRVRLQSGQIAGHLDEVREELDRREAQLNARVAESDEHLRQARLWLQERDAQLNDRAEALARAERELADRREAMEQAFNEAQARYHEDRRTAELDRREAMLAQREARLAEQERATEAAIRDLGRDRQQRESQLRREQQKLERRRLEVDQHARQQHRALARRRQVQEEEFERTRAKLRLASQYTFEQENRQKLAELEDRQRLIDDAEALLAEGQQELNQQIRHWQARQLREENDLRSGRQQLAEAERQHEEQTQQRSQALSRRGEQLDAREAAQRQASERVAQVHQETLELRVAVEELWAKLTGVIPQPKLVAELEQIRGRMADHFRLEQTALREERARLEAAEARLESQHGKLQAEKQELVRWVAQRSDEIERQAARLATREQELGRLSRQLDEQSSDWDEERRTYQREIRNLLAELRQRPAAVEMPLAEA